MSLGTSGAGRRAALSVRLTHRHRDHDRAATDTQGHAHDHTATASRNCSASAPCSSATSRSRRARRAPTTSTRRRCSSTPRRSRCSATCSTTRRKDLDFQAIGGLEVGAIPMAAAALTAFHRNGRHRRRLLRPQAGEGARQQGAGRRAGEGGRPGGGDRRRADDRRERGAGDRGGRSRRGDGRARGVHLRPACKALARRWRSTTSARCSRSATSGSSRRPANGHAINGPSLRLADGRPAHAWPFAYSRVTGRSRREE